MAGGTPPVGEVVGLGDPVGDGVPLGDAGGDDGDTVGDGLVSALALGLTGTVGRTGGRIP